MSNIDPTKPVYGSPTTESVRNNFLIAKNEITSLENKTTEAPFLPIAGGYMTGAITLPDNPLNAYEAATKLYVDTHIGSGGGSGGGGIPEAPLDGNTYGRQYANWNRVIAASNDVVDGGNF